MKTLKKLVMAAAIFSSSLNAVADFEYLRFQGTIFDYYAPGMDYGFGDLYDESYGFNAGQSVLFDFRVNTSIDAEGKQDAYYQDYFYADYLGGTIHNSGENSYGVTKIFPEMATSWLSVGNGLLVGNGFTWYDSGFVPDERISGWEVGDYVQILSKSYYTDQHIGSLQLTHRASYAPPAPVPLPAAVWLFASALISFIGWHRKRNHIDMHPAS